MIYLDTHIAVWLYAGLLAKFNPSVITLMNDNDLYIAPIVRLELQFLFEIQRLNDPADVVIEDLSNRIGLRIYAKDFASVIRKATTFSWTRDPFDRLIVANAGLNDNPLVTKDQNILGHYSHATW